MMIFTTQKNNLPKKSRTLYCLHCDQLYFSFTFLRITSHIQRKSSLLFLIASKYMRSFVGIMSNNKAIIFINFNFRGSLNVLLKEPSLIIFFQKHPTGTFYNSPSSFNPLSISNNFILRMREPLHPNAFQLHIYFPENLFPVFSLRIP